uniref:Uncharacterized protein n=1 Tax=viral metagenome TaxID=1070528 RepID=A0A6M3JP70_9ZZZZ
MNKKGKILRDMERVRVCPGSRLCGVSLCTHSAPHAKTEGCDNGCYGNSGCVPLEGVKDE